MTCQASLHKASPTRHPAASMFADVLRQNLWVACCGVVLLCVNVFMAFSGLGEQMELLPGQRFRLLDANSSTTEMYGYLTVLVSVVLGVHCFRFLLNKTMANLYGSLGVKRSVQFVFSLSAGWLLAALVQVAAFSVMLGLNLKNYGSSAQLMQAWAFLLAECVLQGITAVTVAAAVTATVGTMTEGLVFSGFLMFLPVLSLYTFFGFARVFLWGNSMDVHLRSGILQNIGVEETFATSAVQHMTPALFVKEHLAYSGSAYLDPSGTWISNGQGTAWRLPEVTVLLWWGLAVLFLTVSGLVLYRRRQWEIAGFTGRNKVLNSVFILLSCLFVCGLSCRLLEPYFHWWGALAAGTALMAVAYVLLNLFLLRDKAMALRSLRRLPWCAGAGLLCAAVMLCGGFGYTGRVPELEQIEHVSITLPSRAQHLGYYSETQAYSVNEDCFYPFYDVKSVLFQLHTQRDIRLVQALHRELISLGKNRLSLEENDTMGFDVLYTLKNGSTVWRHYENVPAELWKKALAVHESDRAREAVNDGFTAKYQTSAQESPDDKIYRSETFLSAVAQRRSVLFLPADRTQEHEVTMESTEDYEKLKRCLKEDLAGRGVSELFYPENPTMGYLDMGASNIDGNADRRMARTMFSSVRIPIRADMVKTVAFLKERNLLAFFSSPLTIQSVFVMDAETYHENPFGQKKQRKKGRFPTFEGISFSQKASFTSGEFMRAKQSMRQVTDKQRQNELWKAARDQYFDDGNGVYLLFELSDGDTSVTAYLPGKSVPAWLIS